MIAHTDLQLAVRNYARTLVVVTTGLTALSATTSGYARAAGSFYDDGFAPGMEVTPVGFPETTPGTITALTATTLTIQGGRTAAIAAGARLLTVGLPSRRAWEGRALVPEPNQPFVEEQYTPGPSAQVTIGPKGEIEAFPTYSLNLYVPNETDLTASRYADALLRLFAPRTAIPLASGDVIRVRSDVNPVVGQLQPGPVGWQVKPLSIFLRIRTSNLI